MIKERQWKSIASFQYTTINSVFIQAHKTIQYIKAKNMIIDYLETENNDRITSASLPYIVLVHYIKIRIYT